jgi:hypothetical protein
MNSLKEYITFLFFFSIGCILYMFGSTKLINKVLDKREERLKTKGTMLLLIILMVTGCASLTYQAPDGTKVTYTRFLTGSDTIKGKVGDAIIESKGQKSFDPAVLEAAIDIMGKVK